MKSAKEVSFISKHNFMLIFNLIFSPIIGGAITEYTMNHTDSCTFASMCAEALQNLGGYYGRVIMQIILLCFICQMMMDPAAVLACFEKVIKNNHKTRFDHWYNDLSFKSSIVVSVFCFGLFMCLIYPHLSVLVIFGLCIQLFIDKYNLMYIYPLEFES